MVSSLYLAHHGNCCQAGVPTHHLRRWWWLESRIIEAVVAVDPRMWKRTRDGHSPRITYTQIEVYPDSLAGWAPDDNILLLCLLYVGDDDHHHDVGEDEVEKGRPTSIKGISVYLLRIVFEHSHWARAQIAHSEIWIGWPWIQAVTQSSFSSSTSS